MALMKCPECNQPVSSRATQCPNCGCPIEAIKAESISIQKAKIKKALPVFLSLIAAFLCLVALYQVAQKASHQGYYGHHKWGASFESFQKAYPEDKDSKGNQDGDSFFRMSDSFGDIKNLDTLENYSFDNKKLYAVNVILTPSDESDLTARQISKIIIERYNKYYGTAEYSENSIAKIHKWHAPKSDITLYISSASNLVMIDFKDPSHTESTTEKV